MTHHAAGAAADGGLRLTTLDGRYHVIDRVAAGGMGEVFRARDAVLDREVAIKVLHRSLAGDQGFVERFRREAQAAANLNHPNIVTIHDVGESDGDPYIAMELLDGEPLDDLLKRTGQFGAEHLISIGLQLVEALAYAHSLGVVHRDVKPSNVMISRDGRSAKLGWQMQDYNAHGAVGNAAAATGEKGHALLSAMGRSLAQLLEQIDQLPADTLQRGTAFGPEKTMPPSQG